MAQATDDLNANPTQAQQILEEVRELRLEVEQATKKITNLTRSLTTARRQPSGLCNSPLA